MGLGRLAVLALAILVAGGGFGAAIGEALGDDSSARTVDSIELRKDDRGDEFVDEETDDDPDGDGTRGADGTCACVDTGGNGQAVGDRDHTRGDDGTRKGNNTGDRDHTRGNDGTRGGNNSGDGDRTVGNDGSAGGDNSYEAPAPAPNYGGGGGDWSGDGGGSDG
jgi:hypothetical protein